MVGDLEQATDIFLISFFYPPPFHNRRHPTQWKAWQSKNLRKLHPNRLGLTEVKNFNSQEAEDGCFVVSLGEKIMQCGTRVNTACQGDKKPLPPSLPYVQFFMATSGPICMYEAAQQPPHHLNSRPPSMVGVWPLWSSWLNFCTFSSQMSRLTNSTNAINLVKQKMLAKVSVLRTFHWFEKRGKSEK